jgi:putative ATPase
LPHVESGAVILVGATTENPSFEVNAALLSRARVVVLKPLGPEDLRQIIDRALADPERGLAAELGRGAQAEALVCEPAVRDLLAAEARGDARRALSTLEAAAAVATPDTGGRRVIDRAAVEEALQRKTLLYDKGGEEHYNVVSAFIKSMRGSDPDAAVYWMLRMLDAGEDPIFVLRRMVIFASEDVGNADPQALQVAVAALEAFKLMGLPEGLYPLTQAATYLSCAPKSNSAGVAFSAARADIEAHGALPVPLHLRKAPTLLMKRLGYGKGYLYPHDFAGHHVGARYLPDALAGRRYYEPSDSGLELHLRARLEALRAEVARAEELAGSARQPTQEEEHPPAPADEPGPKATE